MINSLPASRFPPKRGLHDASWRRRQLASLPIRTAPVRESPNISVCEIVAPVMALARYAMIAAVAVRKLVTCRLISISSSISQLSKPPGSMGSPYPVSFAPDAKQMTFGEKI